MCKTICAGVVVAFLMTIVGTFGYVLFLSIYDCKVHSVLGLIIGLMVLLGSVLLLGSRLKKDMALINGQGESATRFPILTIAMKYTIIPVLLGGTMLILSQEEGGGGTP